MFKRLLWLVIGIAFGFGCSWWITRTIRRTIEQLTPEHMAQNMAGMVHGLGGRLREAVAEGREAMVERELDIRAALEPGAPLPSQLYPARLADRMGLVYLPPADDRALVPVAPAGPAGYRWAAPGSRPPPHSDRPVPSVPPETWPRRRPGRR